MSKAIMGIDAGFANMGVVVAVGDTIIYCATEHTAKASKKKAVRVADDDAERCQQLARFLFKVIKMCSPAGVVVELPGGGAQGARANRSMGMASAIVATVLEATGLPAEWVTPQAVKLAAGRKDANKTDVQAAARAAFKWGVNAELVLAQTPKGEHEHIYDAAGALLAARDGTLMRLLQKGA